MRWLAGRIHRRLVPLASPLAGVLGVCAVACGGDDILDRADAIAQKKAVSTRGSGPGQTSTAADRPVERGEPEPVQAADPPPVQPEEPAPGVPEEPAPGASLQVEGPAVVLSGVVEVPGWKGGPVRIDVFDGDQQAAAEGAARPGVVAVAWLERPGPFDVRVAASTGQVWVGAFADEDRDGRPGPGDPTGWFAGNPVPTDGDHGGLALSLVVGEPEG